MDLLQSATLNRWAPQFNSVFLTQRTIHNVYWIYNLIYWCYTFFLLPLVWRISIVPIVDSVGQISKFEQELSKYSSSNGPAFVCISWQPARYSSYSRGAPSLPRDGSVLCAKTLSVSMTRSYGVWNTSNCPQRVHSVGQDRRSTAHCPKLHLAVATMTARHCKAVSPPVAMFKPPHGNLKRFCFPSAEEDSVCYGELGCFSVEEPWSSPLRPVPLPARPEVIQTRFYLYTRYSTRSADNNRDRLVKH